MKNNSLECPACNNGIITITGRSLTDEGWKDNPPIDITCITCDGTSTISEEYKKRLGEEQDSWHDSDVCQEEDAHYVPDNTPGALVSKHHWVCNGCRKIVQVG